MESILHLVDADDLGACAAYAIQCLASEYRDAAQLVLVGRGESIERARRLGVREDIAVRAPANRIRTIRTRLVNRLRPASIVHAWSMDAWRVGRRVASGTPSVLSLGWTPAFADARTRLIRADSRTLVTVPDHSTARRIGQLGLTDGLVTAWPIPEVLDGGRREHLRRELGIQDDEKVLLALGEPTSEISAKTATYQAGVASVVGARMVALLSENSRQIDRALRFTLLHHGAWRVLLSHLDPAELLACADLVLVQSGSSGSPNGRSLRAVASHAVVERAVSLGIPVVGADGDDLRTVIGGGRAVFAKADTPLALNRAIQTILHEPIEGESTARDVPSRSAGAYVAAMRGVYARACQSPLSTH